MKHVLLLLLWTSFSLAGHGPHFLGASPFSSALGGAGVSLGGTPLDALYKNPASLNDLDLLPKYFEVSLAGRFATTFRTSNGGSGDKSSTAGPSITPSIALAHRISKRLSIGVGYIPFVRNSANFETDSELFKIGLNYEAARVLFGTAYRVYGPLRIGMAPFFTMGQLQFNYSTGTDPQTTRAPHYGFGSGIMFGAQLRKKAFAIGATFISGSKAHFNEIINYADFGNDPTTSNEGIEISNPAEIAAGTSLAIGKNLTLLADYRLLLWSGTAFFGELGWADQHALSAGLKIKGKSFSFRSGINFATSPLGDNAAVQTIRFQNQDISANSYGLFRGIAFPVGQSIDLTAGFTLRVNPNLELSIAGQYSLPITTTQAGSGFSFSSTTNDLQISAGMTHAF